jgi:hypothetical protein
MGCNVGAGERAIRIVAGVILLPVGYLAGLPSWAAVIVYAAGAIALLTGSVRFCPVWWLFGINTCGPESQKQH